jgi:TrmH family RNA methyltransferase
VFVTEGSESAAAAASDPGLAALEVHVVTRRVAEKITTLQTPPDVIAVFPLVEPPPLESLQRNDLVAVYADRVADPGNMGTLVRAAAAFAAAALIASPGCVDLFSPKVVRGSMGALFGLPLYPELHLSDAARSLGATRLYGLVAHGGAPLWSAELARPALVCVGAERAGLGEQVLRQITDPLTIPLAEGGGTGVESLNAGVAGAIALYELARRAARSTGAADWSAAGPTGGADPSAAAAAEDEE